MAKKNSKKVKKMKFNVISQNGRKLQNDEQNKKNEENKQNEKPK